MLLRVAWIEGSPKRCQQQHTRAPPCAGSGGCEGRACRGGGGGGIGDSGA